MKKIVLMCSLALASGCSSEEAPKVYEPVPVGSISSVQEHDIEGIGTVRVGANLEHPKFGIGQVVSIQAGGPITEVLLKFPSGEERWIGAELAGLKIVDAP